MRSHKQLLERCLRTFLNNFVLALKNVHSSFRMVMVRRLSRLVATPCVNREGFLVCNQLYSHLVVFLLPNHLYIISLARTLLRYQLIIRVVCEGFYVCTASLYFTVCHKSKRNWFFSILYEAVYVHLCLTSFWKISNTISTKTTQR